jgi:hypothetical protein
MDQRACPHCGGELGEEHVSHARVPLETEVHERGELSTRYETMSVLAWRCTVCRRVVRGIGGTLVAGPEPDSGPLEWSPAKVDDSLWPAMIIGIGILLFLALCLLFAIALGQLK